MKANMVKIVLKFMVLIYKITVPYHQQSDPAFQHCPYDKTNVGIKLLYF